MHPFARVLAIAYIVLAAVGAVVYVSATVNYVNVTDVQIRLGSFVSVVGVSLNWSGNASDVARVVVAFKVTNPGNVALIVMNVDFSLYMDNPTDARRWFDPAKLVTTFVAPGGFDLGRETGPVVHPGETRTFDAIVVVEPGTHRMDVLNRSDASGRFHPIVWGPRIVYTFVDFDVQDSVYLDPYYSEAGVVANGP